MSDNALDEEPLAWCPGCGDRILTRVVRERGVCSECWGTRDDPWATARADRPSVTDDALAVREAAMNLYRAMRRTNPDAWAEVDEVEDWTYWDDIVRTVQVTLAAGRAETTTDQALAEAWAEGHRTGWEHCQDGNYGNDHWDDPTPNPYAAARAETTTATTEDVARVLDDVIQHLRKIWSTGHDEAREVIDAAEELLVQALPHLTTARARPTREQIDRAVGEVLSNAANHPDPVAVLGRSIAPLRAKITDAVLELL